MLIRALYRQTETRLKRAGSTQPREPWRGGKKALRAALADWPTQGLQVETARHYPPYWQGLHVTAHVVFASLLREIEATKS